MAIQTQLPISKPKEVKPQIIGDIENSPENESSFQRPSNPLTLPKFDYLKWINLSGAAKSISKETIEVGGSIKELFIVDIFPARGSINFQNEKPEDEKKKQEGLFIINKNREMAAAVQNVTVQKEGQATQDAVRLEVASQSDEQLATEGGYQKLYKKVRTVYNIMSIVFKRMAEIAKKKKEATKPAAIAKNRASAMNAAMEGGSGQNGSGSANLSATGGGAG